MHRLAEARRACHRARQARYRRMLDVSTAAERSVVASEMASLEAEARRAWEECSVLSRQADGGLPAGWTEAMDPTTNRMYWYQATTGQSSWTRPTAYG